MVCIFFILSFGGVVVNALWSSWSKLHTWWTSDSNERLKRHTLRLLTKGLIIDSEVRVLQNISLGS